MGRNETKRHDGSRQCIRTGGQQFRGGLAVMDQTGGERDTMLCDGGNG